MRYYSFVLGSFGFIILFFYYFFQSSLNIYPGNFLLAFAGCCIFFRTVSWDLILFLFFLGWINGLDSSLEFYTAIYYLAIVLLFLKIKNYFKFEKLKVKLVWWICIILGYLILRNIIYFYTLQIDTPINLMLFLNIFIKSNIYFFTTFIDTLIFYGILKTILSEKIE